VIKAVVDSPDAIKADATTADGLTIYRAKVAKDRHFDRDARARQTILMSVVTLACGHGVVSLVNEIPNSASQKPVTSIFEVC
jgi:hypothetical protein